VREEQCVGAQISAPLLFISLSFLHRHLTLIMQHQWPSVWCGTAKKWVTKDASLISQVLQFCPVLFACSWGGPKHLLPTSRNAGNKRLKKYFNMPYYTSSAVVRTSANRNYKGNSLVVGPRVHAILLIHFYRRAVRRQKLSMHH
jgi:hypothetical protein